jgi:hypothetical protein
MSVMQECAAVEAAIQHARSLFAAEPAPPLATVDHGSQPLRVDSGTAYSPAAVRPSAWLTAPRWEPQVNHSWGLANKQRQRVTPVRCHQGKATKPRPTQWGRGQPRSLA